MTNGKHIKTEIGSGFSLSHKKFMKIMELSKNLKYLYIIVKKTEKNQSVL